MAPTHVVTRASTRRRRSPPAEQCCYTCADLHPLIEPGVSTLSFGTSSVDRPVAIAIELVAPSFPPRSVIIT
jgi:hypothetical protein